MRKIANLKSPKKGIVRLMIHNDTHETYLFGFKNLMDCGAEWDEWYESETDAMDAGLEGYGVESSEWTEIPNPEPNCQHDWINPVRIQGRADGKPEHGKLEKYVHGEWVEITPTE